MATNPTLDDIDHTWGEDLQLSPSGDLARVSGEKRTTQRILRRFMTARDGQEYKWEEDYGGGLPQEIGGALDLAKIRGIITGQLGLEASVSPTPAPVVTLREAPGGVAVTVQYIALPDKQPVSLSFSLTN